MYSIFITKNRGNAPFPNRELNILTILVIGHKHSFQICFIHWKLHIATRKLKHFWSRSYSSDCLIIWDGNQGITFPFDKDHFPKLFDTTQDIKYFKSQGLESLMPQEIHWAKMESRGLQAENSSSNLALEETTLCKLLKAACKETRIFWKPSIRTVSTLAFICITPLI